MSIGQIIFLGVATAFVLFVAGLVTWTISADDSRRARIGFWLMAPMLGTIATGLLWAIGTNIYMIWTSLA